MLLSDGVGTRFSRVLIVLLAQDARFSYEGFHEHCLETGGVSNAYTSYRLIRVPLLRLATQKATSLFAVNSDLET